MVHHTVWSRVREFTDRYRLGVPILQAPMAGACPAPMAVEVANAGAMGGYGAVLDDPAGIAAWAAHFRSGSGGPFQINLWIPDAPLLDDREAAVRTFLARFGEPGQPAGAPPSFADQCEAVLDASPTVISSIMGVFEPEMVTRIHDAGISWFACVTTLSEALAAQGAGADAVVAQGAEAGGHRGGFDQVTAGDTAVGLTALIPQLADTLTIPVVATGGLGDGRGIAAALVLGASAVQLGSAYLRSPEAGIDPTWAAALGHATPETTIVTRAYSGRPGRALPTSFNQAWAEHGAPEPAAHPTQRRLVGQWRRGTPSGPTVLDPVNPWAGQAAGLARAEPAAAITRRVWDEASELLR